ncbi:MAG: hypothetical protein KAH57_09600 [Thermoplasmata archaeon]|nr:hypothetical protein [Thermoplasmata archaeon]
MTPSEIMRKCILCGRNLRIVLHESGEYTGGNFFRKVKLPVGDGENISLGKQKVLEMEVVEWTGDHEEMEYWECEGCFNEE